MKYDLESMEQKLKGKLQVIEEYGRFYVVGNNMLIRVRSITDGIRYIAKEMEK